MSPASLSTYFLVTLSIAVGGALNVMGIYNQRHIVGIESSRALTYSNTPYDSTEKGINFLDSKVSRSLITTVESVTKEGFMVEGVEYTNCKAPPGFFIYRSLNNIDSKLKVKLSKQGTYTSCTFLY